MNIHTEREFRTVFESARRVSKKTLDVDQVQIFSQIGLKSSKFDRNVFI